MVICCGVKPYAHQAQWACHQVNAHDPWCWISTHTCRYHGGPYHLNGVLVFGLLLGNASDYPWWVIPMQGLSNLHKPWWGCWGWLLDSACHSTTSWVRVACAVIWAVAVVCGPDHPLPQATKKDPLEWAWQVLLWPYSHCVGSTDLDGMIFTQLEGRTSSWTSSSVKVVSGSIICQSSNTPSVKWQDSLGIGGWAFSAQYWRAFAYAKVFWGCGSQKSWLMNYMSRRGRNQSLSREWQDGGTECSLSTPTAHLHTFGTSKDAHTFHANSWMLSQPGTSLSSCHQASVSSCHACQFINSVFCMVEGSGSSDIEVCGRPFPVPAPGGSISSPLRNSLDIRLQRGQALEVSFLGWDQSDWSPGTLSSPQVGKWSSLTLASLSGPHFGEGAPSSSKVTLCLGQEGRGDGAHLLAESPCCDITEGPQAWCSAVGDLHLLWLPEHLWLLEHWWLQLREQLILSILSSKSAVATNAHQWESLAMVKASLQESHLMPMNLS